MNQLFNDIIKAINAAVNLKFIIVASAQSSIRVNVYVTIFCYFTVMFLSWNWEKVYSSRFWDNIKKDCKIHIEVPENYECTEKFLFNRNIFPKNDLHTP